jgi:hypothetical protein
MAQPSEKFLESMGAASGRAIHYEPSIKHPDSQPLKNKEQVTNIHVGRGLTTLSLAPSDEPVEAPKDMTRQIPRYNGGTQMGYTAPFKVAGISHNVPYVPRRVPEVVHGVNGLRNSQANVITKDAEFFGAQQSVKAVKDHLNYDPLDKIQKDMTRIQKAEAKDEVTAKAGLHNTNVVRTRTRRRAGDIYV